VEVGAGRVDGEGGDVGGGDGEVVEVPFAEGDGRSGGVEGDFEGIEAEGDALAGGFKECFFAGPAAEEGAAALGGGEGEKGGVFGGGEEALSEVFEREIAVERFDVDAEFVIERDGEEDHAGGVGEVEVEGMIFEMGLAVRIDDEGELLRGRFQEVGKCLAEEGAGDEGFGTFGGDAEAGDSLFFFVGDEGFEASEGCGGEIGGSEEDVDAVGSESEVGRHGGPGVGHARTSWGVSRRALARRCMPSSMETRGS